MIVLPWPLQLTQGTAAVRLCPPGSIDPLRLLERSGLASEHELEFVTREAPGGPGAYAVIRIRAALPLPDLEVARARLGVSALPPAAAGLVRARPERPLPGEKGLLRARVVPGREAGLVRRLQAELSAPELIAWIEAGWGPIAGELSHRYYLDRAGTPWMVRDEAGRRTLHAGEVSPEAAPHLIPRAERPAR